MSEKLLRVYKKFDVKEVKKSLLICGDLSASCANCKEMDIKFGTPKCPSCSAEFKYISFRNVKTQIPKLYKIFAETPSIQIIDFDDFKRAEGEAKAQDFLNL